MSGAEEAVEFEAGAVEDGLKRRHDGDMVTENRKVLHAHGFGLAHRHGRGRRRGFETHGEKHHLTVRVAYCQFQRVEGGIHHAYVGATGFGFEECGSAARNAHHVAERGEDDAIGVGHSDGIVDTAHGDDAYRAAGAVYQLDAGRQDLLDSVAVDGMGMPAAYLHELELLVARQALDLGKEQLGHDGVAILIHKFHVRPA